jgi:hypothetical protein
MTRQKLEERYKDSGSAKIRNGEFILQDLDANRRFDIHQQPWNFIMRPGKKRYMSIKFSESGVAQTSCIHCGTENETVEGRPTTW